MRKNSKYIEFDGVVEIHNDLAKVSLTGFTKQEADIFYALCAFFKNRLMQQLDITFDQLREVTNMEFLDNSSFAKNLKAVNQKMQRLEVFDSYENKNRPLKLFSEFKVEVKKGVLHARVNRVFAYLLNPDLDGFKRMFSFGD